MSYLERTFKKHPALFLTVTFVVAGVIASIFQEIGNAMTNIMTNAGVSWQTVCLIWLGVVIAIFLLACMFDYFWTKSAKNAKIKWDVVNDNYARVHITNNDKFSLDECHCELSEIFADYTIEIRNKFFAWSNEAFRGGSQQTTSIPVGQDSLQDIAKKEKDGKAFFTFAYHKQEIERHGIYTLSLKFSGEKNGVEFMPKPKDFILEYDGKTLKIKPK